MIYKFMATISPIKISQLTKCLTHFIHIVNPLFWAIWLGRWGSVERHFWSDRHRYPTRSVIFGVFIDSRINLADHVSKLTTRTCFIKFINLDLSIRWSLCAMIRTSLDYCNGFLGEKPCDVSHQSVIWRVRKGTVPHCLDISAKNSVKDVRACAPMPSRICSTLSDTSRKWATSLDAHSHISDRLRWAC